jgi:hypothetical protein
MGIDRSGKQRSANRLAKEADCSAMILPSAA